MLTGRRWLPSGASFALSMTLWLLFVGVLAPSPAYAYDGRAHAYDVGSRSAIDVVHPVGESTASPVSVAAVALAEVCDALDCSNATNTADDLLGQARVARNELADQAGSRVATVTGGYDSTTGRVAAGCSGPGSRAEDDVLRQLVELGSDPANVRFTEAIRPRTGLEVPVCVSCQASYFPEQFPASVLFQPGGKWGVP